MLFRLVTIEGEGLGLDRGLSGLVSNSLGAERRGMGFEPSERRLSYALARLSSVVP